MLSFYTCLSVILFTGRGTWSQGVSAPGGAWSEGEWSGGGGVCSQGCVPGPREVGVSGGDPPGTATAVGGTHPTGMHSCLIFYLKPIT